MSTIHGGSHKAIRYFREPPAALSVLWIYCARRNHEGIAYPSLRGLVNDTGWSINLCRDARDWLVQHLALERVEGYVRPDWRALEEKALKRRLVLDHSEYFKVTGRWVWEGKTYPILYAPSESNDLGDDVSRRETSNDVSPRATSYRMIQNLIPEKTQLDSSNAALRARAEIFKAFEGGIGPLTPAVADGVTDALANFPSSWVLDAIEEAAASGGKSFNYVDSILKRWERDGKGKRPPSTPVSRTKTEGAPAKTAAAGASTSRGAPDLED